MVKAIPLVLAAVSVLAVACGGDAPDIVVAVVARCDMVNRDTYAITAVTGPTCDLDVRMLALRYSSQAISSRYLVTVKTGAGATFTAEVPKTQPVSLGDHWPLTAATYTPTAGGVR